jgi:hypothetical protein
MDGDGKGRLGLLGSELAGGAPTECRFVPIAVASAEDKVCDLPQETAADTPPVIELVPRNGRVLPLARGCGAGTSRRAR